MFDRSRKEQNLFEALSCRHGYGVCSHPSQGKGKIYFIQGEKYGNTVEKIYYWLARRCLVSAADPVIRMEDDSGRCRKPEHSPRIRQHRFECIWIVTQACGSPPRRADKERLRIDIAGASVRPLHIAIGNAWATPVYLVRRVVPHNAVGQRGIRVAAVVYPTAVVAGGVA